MIKVYKNERKLVMFAPCGKELFTCPVSLGFNAEGDKTGEGDGRTPEGEYFICSINRSSKYHISLGISYPGLKDSRNAYAKNRIGLCTHVWLCVCAVFKLRPPWNTALGGYIMLHGESADNKTGDWTAGCIAVSNPDIERIAALCKKGEHIIIYK